MQVMDYGEEWHEYYALFPYFSHDTIRQGCHPRKLIKKDSQKSMVLIHGLSDSPYYLIPLAQHFHQVYGYSVFLPLLQGHGLLSPQRMEGVRMEEWKRNVALSVKEASNYGKCAIGGLSTGATLAFHAMETMVEELDDKLYLFSAALAFSGGLLGRFKEGAVRTTLADILSFAEREKKLVGRFPYRYDYIELRAARELSRLIKEITPLILKYSAGDPYPHRVFAAHHVDDSVVSFEAVEDFLGRVAPDRRFLFAVPSEMDVAHAEVVLDHNIYSRDGARILEKKNPLFDEMIKKMEEMEGKHD